MSSELLQLVVPLCYALLPRCPAKNTLPSFQILPCLSRQPSPFAQSVSPKPYPLFQEVLCPSLSGPIPIQTLSPSLVLIHCSPKGHTLKIDHWSSCCVHPLFCKILKTRAQVCLGLFLLVLPSGASVLWTLPLSFPINLPDFTLQKSFSCLLRLVSITPPWVSSTRHLAQKFWLGQNRSPAGSPLFTQNNEGVRDL